MYYIYILDWIITKSWCHREKNRSQKTCRNISEISAFSETTVSNIHLLEIILKFTNNNIWIYTSLYKYIGKLIMIGSIDFINYDYEFKYSIIGLETILLSNIKVCSHSLYLGIRSELWVNGLQMIIFAEQNFLSAST
jgi:hypothetical protein